MPSRRRPIVGRCAPILRRPAIGRPLSGRKTIPLPSFVSHSVLVLPLPSWPTRSPPAEEHVLSGVVGYGARVVVPTEIEVARCPGFAELSGPKRAIAGIAEPISM